MIIIVKKEKRYHLTQFRVGEYYYLLELEYIQWRIIFLDMNFIKILSLFFKKKKISQFVLKWILDIF